MARYSAVEDIDRLTKQLISSLTGFQVIWVHALNDARCYCQCISALTIAMAHNLTVILFSKFVAIACYCYWTVRCQRRLHGQ